MSRILQTTGRYIDTIRINGSSRETRDGRIFWVKRRRRWSGPVALCANLFFRIVGNPVSVWSKCSAWQTWELDSFQLLHGEETYRTFSDGTRAVWTEEVPGEGLANAVSDGNLTEAMLASAARELRRAHALHCDWWGGAWSHGDPHLDNFLFDPVTGRARLIDFELAHQRELGEAERHADDLLVFLQDLMGRIDGARWLTTATCFLHHYSNCDGEMSPERVISILRERLVPPRGVSRVWWAIRTGYLPATERERRILELRAALQVA